LKLLLTEKFLKMKKTGVLNCLILVMSVIIVITGCSKEKSLLRQAEVILKRHIGNGKSYSRIECGIADTVFRNDLKMAVLVDSIIPHEDNLKKIDKSHRLQTVDILNLRIHRSSGNRQKVENQNRGSKPPAGSSTKYEKHYKIYSINDLDKAVSDSVYLENEIKKEHITIDSLGAVYDGLKAARRASPIETISIIIRFSAKLESESPIIFKSIIDYDFNSKEYQIRETSFDRINKEVK
jgi:hypothetical protein